MSEDRSVNRQGIACPTTVFPFSGSIGSAIRYAQWLPEAVNFCKNHQTLLARRPTAIFSLHMQNLGIDPDSRSKCRADTDAVRKYLYPNAEEFFAGKIDLALLSCFERMGTKPARSPVTDPRE